ncbi:FAD/NAD-P-binding domain-containing protein [Fimicolochytrium jonesii]|uniref:FAD/NAD-P-binding domain-containing protein n=1 Tax=Fimicolochytrium jonesii TaxID=1396493 RepID=UPI0022FE8975|nr:FAD/NAD-P-binding domain-containing protein [Fimicolochytrium jonesii]KAI8818148.1 FAD/NAD-P-binding domain-containing protein [Fimicolochytrium jonesii]
MTKSLKNIVIVGASYLGKRAATALAASQALSAAHRIILIERNSHFSHLFQFPRISIIPGYEHKALIPFDNLFRDAVCQSGIVRAAVTKVAEGHVELDREVAEFGTTVPYEFLVYATGSRLSPPGNVPGEGKQEGIAYFRGIQVQAAKAKRIVCIGGGAVGVQIATDLKTYMPEKEVHIVHSRATLLNRFHPDLHKTVLDTCIEYGIHTHLNSRATIPQGGFPNGQHPFTITLSDGTSIPDVDLALTCTGQTFNSGPIAHLVPQHINPDGTVHVLPTLQVPTHPHIFCVGDINDILRIKTVKAAIPQIDVLVSNITSLSQNELASAVVAKPRAGIHLTIGVNREVFCRMESQVEGAAGEVERRDFEGDAHLTGKRLEGIWEQLGAGTGDMFR